MSAIFGHGDRSRLFKESKENLELVGSKSPPTITITWSDILNGLFQKTPITKLDQNQHPIYVFVG